MPYTTTSLGQWMKTQYRERRKQPEFALSYTTGMAPWYPGYAPRGALAKWHRGSQYANRFGVIRYRLTADGKKDDTLLKSALVSDGHALFAFHPEWARTLPGLAQVPNVNELLEECAPGDLPFLETPPLQRGGRRYPYGPTTTATRMHALFEKVCGELAYWPKEHRASSLYTEMIAARYRPTRFIRYDKQGHVWVRLTSLQIANYQRGGSKPWNSYPDEKLSVLTDGTPNLYVRKEQLGVLGRSLHEWDKTYAYYVLDPKQPCVTVVDVNACCIVAVLSCVDKSYFPASPGGDIPGDA